MCLPYYIYMYNTAKHLVFLNWPVFELLDRQLTNTPTDADLPGCYTLVSLFYYKERDIVVWDAPLVHLSKWKLNEL